MTVPDQRISIICLLFASKIKRRVTRKQHEKIATKAFSCLLSHQRALFFGVVSPQIHAILLETRSPPVPFTFHEETPSLPQTSRAK